MTASGNGHNNRPWEVLQIHTSPDTAESGEGTTSVDFPQERAGVEQTGHE